MPVIFKGGIITATLPPGEDLMLDTTAVITPVEDSTLLITAADSMAAHPTAADIIESLLRFGTLVHQNMKSPSLFKLALLFLPCVLAFCPTIARARGLPASGGITNFGKVDANLYRGAQPDATGIEHLKALGVKTIINLRMPGDVVKAEASDAGANGINYTNVPLAGLGRPADVEVAKILLLIQDSPGPVFIHCEHGCDRTGTLAACYRIQHDGWSYPEAMKEADKYGLSIWERGMRRYIADFAKSAHPLTVKPPSPKP
jgi:protein tyrosine phosphatase (PTP) superfamily phosphohydrolase (DUF442 family)